MAPPEDVRYGSNCDEVGCTPATKGPKNRRNIHNRTPPSDGDLGQGLDTHFETTVERGRRGEQGDPWGGEALSLLSGSDMNCVEELRVQLREVTVRSRFPMASSQASSAPKRKLSPLARSSKRWISQCVREQKRHSALCAWL